MRAELWLRLYVGVSRCAKLQLLPAEDFRTLINLWCIAKENGGELPSVRQVAWVLRVEEGEMMERMERLRGEGLLECEGGVWSPHDWGEWQYPSDDPGAARERKRRERERKRGNGVGLETINRGNCNEAKLSTSLNGHEVGGVSSEVVESKGSQACHADVTTMSRSCHAGVTLQSRVEKRRVDTEKENPTKEKTQETLELRSAQLLTSEDENGNEPFNPEIDHEDAELPWNLPEGPDLSPEKIPPIAPKPELGPEPELVPVKPKRARRSASVLSEWQEPLFREFWLAYWVKSGKVEAERAFAKVVSSVDIFHDVMAGVRKQRAMQVSRLQQGGTAKYAQGWLNGRRWEDEIPGESLAEDDSHERAVERWKAEDLRIQQSGGLF